MTPKNRVALFDIDDTIYQGGIIFPLMESEVKDGLLEKKFVDEVYSQRELHKKGLLAYEELSTKVVEVWAEGLKGQSYEEVSRHAEKFVQNDLAQFYAFAKPLLNLLKETHDEVIITNEPQFVTEPISRIFKFNNFVSTIFEVQEGKLTGKVSRFNSRQVDKKRSIHEVFESYTHEESFAFGDSVGDIGMFEEVTYPICVNASQQLLEIAHSKGWTTTTPDTILETTEKILRRTGEYNE